MNKLKTKGVQKIVPINILEILKYSAHPSAEIEDGVQNDCQSINFPYL